MKKETDLELKEAATEATPVRQKSAKLNPTTFCGILSCAQPAHFLWTPRRHPENAQALCKECGLGCAGNFVDELTLISEARDTVAAVCARTLERVRKMSLRERVQTLVDAGIIDSNGRLMRGYMPEESSEASDPTLGADSVAMATESDTTSYNPKS